MNPPTDLETRLRASLRDNARHAPPDGPLAERILAELDAPVLRPHRSWRTWTFPLLAAAAIAAVALTLAGVGADRDTAAPPVHPGTQPVKHPTPSVQLTTPAVPSPTPTGAAPTTAPPPAPGFHAFDVSFVGTSDGWALGSEPCITAPTHLCTAILRTTDGTHWTGIGGESFNVPDVRQCASRCVQHIRFANQNIGYAYGPNALYMTTDGGANWVRQAGMGADALETLSGNVVLVHGVGGCPSQCSTAETATIGSNTWTPVTVPSGGDLVLAYRVDLARSGNDVILAPIFNNPAKGRSNFSPIYRSSDDGTTWSQVKAPCPFIAADAERQVTAATVGTDGTVAIDCATTTNTSDLTGYGETATSTNGGRTFQSPPNGGKLRPAELIAAGDNGVQLVVVQGTLYRSTDSGDSWSRVTKFSNVTFVGFEDGHDGRAVADDGRTIWTTHDAGASWSGGPFTK